MGRELRRVPLDFAWPLQKVWAGFLNPHWRPCPEQAANNCHGGSTSAGKWLDALARLIGLVGEEGAENTPAARERMERSGRVYPHPWLQEWTMAPRTELPAEVWATIQAEPSSAQRHRLYQRARQQHPATLLNLDSEITELVQGLAGGEPLGLGQASHAIFRGLTRAAGVDPESWGVCKVCKGDGMDPAARDAYEAWQSEPPPTGEGWQLWETTSEGAPISPVFATEVEFVDYLIGEGYSRGAAEEFVRRGWAPTGMGVRNEDGTTTMLRDIETCGTGES